MTDNLTPSERMVVIEALKPFITWNCIIPDHYRDWVCMDNPGISVGEIRRAAKAYYQLSGSSQEVESASRYIEEAKGLLRRAAEALARLKGEAS